MTKNPRPGIMCFLNSTVKVPKKDDFIYIRESTKYLKLVIFLLAVGYSKLMETSAWSVCYLLVWDSQTYLAVDEYKNMNIRSQPL